MAFGQQDDSNVPIPIFPMASGATDNPNAPQSPVPTVPAKIKPFGTTPQKPDYDPNFPLLSQSKGFKAAMEKDEKEHPYDYDPDESTLPKSVLMQRHLNILENSPLYKQANAELRVKFQMAFWKKFVEPLGRENQNPVSLRDWMKARGEEWLKTHPNPKINVGRTFSKDDPFYQGRIPTDLTKTSLAGAHELITQGAGTVDAASSIATHTQWENVKKDWFNLKSQVGAAMALLNGQLAPHMGSLNIDIPHKDINEVHYNPDIPGMGMKLDELYETSKYVQHNYYSDTVKDQLLLKGGGEVLGSLPALTGIGAAGEFAGGLRALDKSTLLTEQTPEEISAMRKLYAAGKVFGRFGVVAGDVGRKSIEGAATGYLMGSMEREGHPTRDAINFAIGDAFFSGGGKLLGKLRVWGDGKVTEEMLDKAVADYTGKQPHATVTPVAVAMAGSPQQKIMAGLMAAINKETGGAFWNAPEAAKKATLTSLAKKYPEFAENAGWLDQHITELQALNQTTQWRELMPEADAALKKLEALSGEPLPKTVAREVADKERAKAIRTAPVGAVAKAIEKPTGLGMIRSSHEDKITVAQGVVDALRTRLAREEAENSGEMYETKSKLAKAEDKLNDLKSKTVPGAARASSLEFGDNFTKHVDQRLDSLGLGKDKYTWESRGHKFLFYLNVLASETKEKGPSTERAQEAQLLMHQLSQEFPGKNLKELLGMSDALWHKISALERGGFVKPGAPTRIFRQTHLGPGESPFAHEVDLLQKAAKADAERARDIKAKLKEEKRAKAAEEAKVGKAAKAEKIEKAPTESKEFKTAAEQYVAALRKLGYSTDDIKKMTPQELVEIISSKKAKAEPKAKELTDDEKLAAAFKKSGDAGTGKIDTEIINEVMERMFPGQRYGDLTSSEQSEVNQVAAKISKARGKQ
jgi:hypothetical protein